MPTDRATVEGYVKEALCCPGGCLRSDIDCWRDTISNVRKTVPSIMEVIDRLVAEERDRCANIALAIDSGRGNEKEIARAIKIDANQQLTGRSNG